MNSFVFSIEENLPRQLKTTGFRIIFLLEKRIIKTGSYITNLNSVFQELFFNGTLYGQTDIDTQTIMEGAKLSDIVLSLQQKADKINANIEIINPTLTLTQEDPWNIKVTLSANILIKDKTNLVSWNKTNNITALVPITNFEDPLYVINTNNLIVNKIIKTSFKNFVQGSDISNLSSHSLNSYYLHSTSAPSFLDRLQGLTLPNEDGIESLVNLAELSSKGVEIKDKSVVDYIYFSSQNPSSCNVIPPGMPTWFKLDDAHLTKYQVSCT